MLKRVVVIVTATVLAIVQAPRVVSGQAGSAPKAAPQTRTQAQADTASMPLVAVTITQVKPDMLLEWQEFQKKETMPTLQKGGVKLRSAYQTVIGPAFEYAFLTPMANLAERDGDSPQVKALGAEGARAMGERARRFIVSTRTIVVRQRTDLSWTPSPSMAGNPVAVISDYSIAAGKTAEFENYIKTEVMPAHKQVKSPGFSVFQTVFGGEPNFVVATAAPNLAALDQGPAITRAFGPAGAARAQQKLAGVVTHVERTVVRLVPDLSFGAPAPSTASR
jgi:hypothetical protein